MRTILSPAESLGLAGATLDSRLKNAARHVSDETFARIAERLRDDAFAEEIVYERDGEREAVRVMLRPLLAYRDQLTYVHNACLRITEALKRLPALYMSDPEIRKIVAISRDEDAWLKDIWTPDLARTGEVYGRLDAVCDFASASWQDTLKFMEPNLSGVGGIHYSPIAESIVMRDVVPTLLVHDPALVIEMPQDQRDLFVQVLIDHARALGRSDCQLCFVEPKYVHEGPDEQSALSRYLSARHGLVITHADPRELTVRNGEVYYEDTRVDVAYRDYELRDLVALEKETGKPLEAMRLLFRENRIVSSLVGDFDHKSGFEILTDPAFAERLFSPEDCRLLRRHVLWTRLVADRRTTLPDGSSGDLLPFVRTHREELVLKPNRGYGGEGVAIGPSMEQGAWDALVDEAAAKGDDAELSWVVQRATRLPVAEFPVVSADGRVFNEPFYAVMGFAPTDNGLGVLCRVSQKQVVNVAQHGGMAALLVAEPPTDLRIPRRPPKPAESVKQELRKRIAELRHLDQTIGLLEWDEETKLPVQGRAQRGEQMATLEGLRHALLASDHLGDLIEEADAQGDGGDQARELYLLRRLRRQAVAVPEDVVRALANAKSRALAAWEEARAANAFAPFAGPFSALLALVRERARCLASGNELYDALLDEYEPGMTRARIEPLFREMREKLVPLVRRASENALRDPPNGARFEEAGQWELSRRILDAIGFDFARGRLDASTHPFTMIAGIDDVRLTGRMDERCAWSAVLTTLHEGGHALYDQGFAAADRDTLLADGASSGMHEGLARLWENHVGRSFAFAEYLAPSLAELFPAIADKTGLRQAWKARNAVQPGANRVGADELSYHLHIILRFELESRLLAGQLDVEALPEIWSAQSAELLGVRPASAFDGVLQDVHWAVGLFGYFPTYTIGSLYAAQLMETYAGQGHDLSAEIRAGNFSALRTWLADGVYCRGNRASGEDIVAEITGRGLDSAAFFAYAAAPERAWNQDR